MFGLTERCARLDPADILYFHGQLESAGNKDPFPVKFLYGNRCGNAAAFRSKNHSGSGLSNFDDLVHENRCLPRGFSFLL